MKVRAFAKINLGLKILGKRADGFHEIETIFARIGLHDDLEFKLRRDSKIIVKVVGADIPSKKNLVWKAANSLQKFYERKVGVDILLKKRIPIGAGLGGGSSDAAMTLKSLNKLWQLKLRKAKLKSLAASLGSDVPFFLEAGIQRGWGRGELLENAELAKNFPKNVLVVMPGFGVSTKEAFSKFSIFSAAADSNKSQFLNSKKISNSKNLVNDFERILFKQYPQFKEIKKALLKSGASLASLSGSGSAVFGLFTKRPDSKLIQNFEKFGQVFAAKIRG
jgi:4-diphosphocytidyl-2-C-methyl-D-erythritol kinase